MFTVEYPDKSLYTVFVVLFICNVMVNVDHGTLPACVEEVKKKFKIENVGFGSLGTAVYAGLSVGSAMGTKLYQKTNNIKFVLYVSLAFNGVCLAGFTFLDNLGLSLLVRFFTGIF